MINISNLENFDEILKSGKNILKNEIGNNKLLDIEINKGLKHSLYDYIGTYKYSKFKSLSIKENRIHIIKAGKKHFVPKARLKNKIEKFLLLKKGTPLKSSDYLFYKQGRKYKTIKVEDFKEKFSNFISCCPYCGKFELRKGNIQLDHFFPKETFPEFKYSLYNIIPSCNICNGSSFKSSNCFLNKGIYFHPYFGELFYDSGMIKLMRNSNIQGKDIDDYINFLQINSNVIDKNMKIWKFDNLIKYHLDFFKLEEIYSTYKCTQDTFATFLDVKEIIDSTLNKYNKKDRLKFIVDKLTRNSTRKWPLMKEQILESGNGKIKKDLYLSLIKDYKDIDLV